MSATPETLAAESSAAVSKERTEREVQQGEESAPLVENSDSKKMPPNEADAAAAAAANAAGGGEAPSDAVSETAPLASSEDAKVTFCSGGDNNDVKVEMGNATAENAKTNKQNEYAAMTKSELVKFANDPFWVTMRWVLFALFWLAWIAMLVGAIVIIVFAPKCPPPEPKQWWQSAPIYELYTKSFKDSNGDGVGDLKGVESKLDYLKSLGVGSVGLTPIYKSPMKDNGYDIQHFVDVDPVFGSLQDFKDLLAGMHDRELKLIMDFVPNHSSDQHEWFEKSVRREEPYTDFYVWRDGKADGGPPTNWMSVFGGSAWEFNADRNQYYLHQFYKETPDLNLRNEKVVEELTDVLRFWLDLGVDGFRVDGVAHFFEDDQFRDESPTSGEGYASVDHAHTFDQAENVELLKRFRKVIDEKTAEDVYNQRIMMTEAYLTVEDLEKYYGGVRQQIGNISHIPINFAMISNFKSPADVTADNVYETVTSYLDGLPDVGEDGSEDSDKALTGAWSNFNTGNHDNSRAANRFGSELMDAMNMVLMLLQGTPITYYGDEIGMSDTDTGTDGERDMYRTPMQWTDEEPSAGFSSGTSPWLKVNANFKTGVNVESQLESESSHLKVYRKLAEWRSLETVMFGSTEFIKNGTFFGFARIKKGYPGILVAVNFGDEDVVQDVTALRNIATKGSVELMSSSYYDPDLRYLSLSDLTLRPKEGMVITFVPNFG